MPKGVWRLVTSIVAKFDAFGFLLGDGTADAVNIIAQIIIRGLVSVDVQFITCVPPRWH